LALYTPNLEPEKLPFKGTKTTCKKLSGASSWQKSLGSFLAHLKNDFLAQDRHKEPKLG
jgi:hypothetical protein